MTITPDRFQDLTRRTVVLGGTGTTGRRVAARLSAAGVPTRAVGRSTPIPFDWTDASIWRPAVDEARAAYVAYSPDVAAPGATEVIAELLETLHGAGVEHVTLLSGRGEPAARAAELLVENSGLSWAVVRSAWFAQNFSEGYLRPAVMGGVLAIPAGGVTEPFLDVDDLAAVAAATLTDARHAGRVHELTGPELLTFDDIAATLSRAAARPVVFADVTRADFIDGAIADGIPEDVVVVLDHLFSEILDGRNSSLTDDVERALGRPATPFASFAEAAARAGSWSDAGGASPSGAPVADAAAAH
ncbi:MULTISPECIES: NmrA family transcriptional regulator [Microbacterium]|uniref:NmrA family transcriptional regulator n=1 Tax=Microbacterium TaxID=33882 RepID=UPI000D658EDE|nr:MULTISPECIES: NmrA family transcriptional regulator [Microbacterium]